MKGLDKPVRVLLGPPNKIDATVYAQKEGDPRIVLLPSTLTTPLEKKLFDFRQKDVFKFETKDVTAIAVAAKGARWDAAKKDDAWMLLAPLKALAKESKITGLLDSLSGLRAKEFAAEDKKAEDLKKYGLDKPEYTVTLKMPGANKETVFAFHKADDKTYVTTSQSTKIIIPEADVLPDLEKKPADLRESKVAAFNSWQAGKVVLKKGRAGADPHQGSQRQMVFRRRPEGGSRRRQGRYPSSARSRASRRPSSSTGPSPRPSSGWTSPKPR